MPVPKYFFIYVLIDETTGFESHIITGDNWNTLIRTRAFVQSGIQVSRLLYLSNVKEGTHHQRLVRGEIPPQAKSPYSVAALAHGEAEPHTFVNAGIGLSPDSVCTFCKGLASEHPDMEIPLAVMARVRQHPQAGSDRAPTDTGGAEDPSISPSGPEDGPAPAEDAFQVGAGGEAGPHIGPRCLDDFEETDTTRYQCEFVGLSGQACKNDAEPRSQYCGLHAEEANVVC